ncbi:MAG TPA: FtsX-like permease family protein [Burkholderiales bacterium]|nr:FtsX-like permease family protein [Burkholderiales bacterium]
MNTVMKLAARNLLRYRRRTALTSTLIVIGVVAVLTFIAVSGSFKNMMIGTITDSMLGHVQVHRRSYVASIDSLPLNLNMSPAMVKKVEEALHAAPGVAAVSERVKFGAMFSNFAETTSIRVNGIDPAREAATTPLLPARVRDVPHGAPILERGEILVPVLLARGMRVKAGDEVVLIATNKDGSVNGRTFKVRSELESVTGPGGRDGYIHIEDARELLRMTQPEVSELTIRLTNLDDVERAAERLAASLAAFTNKAGVPALEVHSWQRLSPFANIAKMIDMLTVFIRAILVAIVLVSVMNVMVMAVYERIREIGTLAAIGTRPTRILAMFVSEGLLLGTLGSAAGILLTLGVTAVINTAGLTFDFGQQQGIPLVAQLTVPTLATVGAMVVAIALLASLQPAWKASRMDPITALRHV